MPKTELSEVDVLVLRALQMIIHQMIYPSWADMDSKRKEKLLSLRDDIVYLLPPPRKD